MPSESLSFAKLRPSEACQPHTSASLDNFRASLLFQLSDIKRFQSLLSDPFKLAPQLGASNRRFEDNNTIVAAADCQTAH